MAIKSVKAIAPNCDSACIAAQLDKYHKKACNKSGNFNVRSSDGISVRGSETVQTENGLYFI